MYVKLEDRQKELKRLAELDLVSQQEVEQAVNTYVKVAARVEHVAKVIANLKEEFAGVTQYSWWVRDFHISLRNQKPKEGMEHLKGIAVTVHLAAYRRDDAHEDKLIESSRSGYHDGDLLSRQVQFPIDYLTRDDWLEDARRAAKESRLWWLKYRLPGMKKGIEGRRQSVETLIRETEETEQEIAALEAEGITSRPLPEDLG